MSSRPYSASAARKLRHQGQVAGRERRDADDVDVVLDRLPGGLGRRREERPDIDVEAEIGEGRGDHLLAAVVAVLAHLGDQDAGPPPVIALERFDEVAHPFDCRRHRSRLPLVDARDGLDLGPMPAPDPLQRDEISPTVALLPRRVDARGREGCQTALASRAGQGVERARDGRLVALGAEPAQLVELERPDGGIVDPQARRADARRPACTC